MAKIVVDNVHLPEWYEQGAKVSSYFDVTVQRNTGGFVMTNLNNSRMLHRADIGYGMSDKDDYLSLKEFHAARRGRTYGFLFRDHGDYESFGQELIGTGDGAEDDFQLIHIYDYASDPRPFSRKITRPRSGSTLKIYVADVLKTVTTHYTVTNGLIHFLTPPTMGQTVKAEYEFDIPMMFDFVDLDIVLTQIEAGEVPSINLTEIPE